MRSFLILIFKTITGGILGALVFLGIGSAKGLFDALIEIIFSLRPSSIIYIPIGVFLGAWYAFWLGGDLILVAMLIGSEIAFLKNLRKTLLNLFSAERVNKIYQTVFLGLLAITAFSFYTKIQTIIKIESVYSKFCSSVLAKDYPSAYKYLSAEYRNQTNLNQFVKDKLYKESSYVSGCNANGYSIKFISSFGKSASVFPNPYIVITSFANFPGGSELIMEEVDGEWFFTGKDKWYAD